MTSNPDLPRPASFSDAVFRALAESQAEPASLAHADGTLAWVNAAYARLFGRTISQMTGSSLFDLAAFADQETTLRRVASLPDVGAIELGEPAEIAMAAAGGSAVWIEWRHTLQHDGRGRPLIHSVGHDVTRRRQAERALHACRASRSRIGQVAGAAGWELCLADGRLVWSEEARRIFEAASDPMPTRASLLALFPADAQPELAAALERAARDGDPVDLELPCAAPQGCRTWLRIVAEAEPGSTGAPVRLVGVLQDVTQRRQLEQRLADSESFAQHVTDSVPVRIAYVDSDRRYRFVNRSHCQSFGRNREDILGRTRSELSRGPHDALIARRVSAALRGEMQRFEFEEPLGDAMRLIEGRMIPDVADNGEVRGYFSTHIDITERAAAESALRELTAIFEHTTDYVVQTDQRGRISYMNPSARQATGLTPDEPVAHRTFREFITPETESLLDQVILPAVDSGRVWIGKTTLVLEHGRVVPASHMVIGHRGAGDGQVTRYSSVMRDISAQIESEREMLRQTTILRSVAEAIPDSVAVIGTDGRYRFVNSAFERWLGVPRDRLIGHTGREVLGEHEFARRRPWIKRAMAGEAVTFEAEYRDRETTHLSIRYVPVRLGSGAIDGLVMVSYDITQQKLEQGRLLQLSQRDALTGLLNRVGFEHALEQQTREGGSAASLALLYIDLDHFKPINDQHGHPVGDRALQIFAKRLGRLVRPSDAVARLGGDEFAVALFGLQQEARAQAVADAIVEVARQPLRIRELVLNIGASVGIALGTQAGVGWRELVERADRQLLDAKASGRGCSSGMR